MNYLTDIDLSSIADTYTALWIAVIAEGVVIAVLTGLLVWKWLK